MNNPADDPYLRVDNLCKIYATRDAEVRALNDLSFTQRRGEFLSHVGPSGCGKSTLLMIAAGLVPPSGGAVCVAGRSIDRPRTDIGIVFQSPVLLEWRTALGNVLLQAEARKMDLKDAERRARELLGSVGLGGFEDRYPHELSGGMRQRVSICRALIHNPDHLLMDEPFGALDALTRDQLVLDLQALVIERRMTVLFITHSIAEAVFLSDRVIVMTPRPGCIDRIIDIKLPRPRTLAMRESPEFADYSRQILDLFLARGVLREH
ncbi:MAG TPA: ABC transporter ATP-binding protein [Xanthobacteraceae bacterium]|nr:ABC transporter ATP-binding protein [Xanthobacteraceae bacterium]